MRPTAGTRASPRLQVLVSSEVQLALNWRTTHNYLRMSIRVATEAAPAGATRLLAARAVSARAIAAQPAVLLGTLRISAACDV